MNERNTIENLFAMIRAEIQRRKKENNYKEDLVNIGRYYEDRDLLSYLDELENPGKPSASSRFSVILDAAQRAAGKQLEPGRHRDDVIIRYVVCHQMVLEGFHPAVIGALLGKHRVTVMYGDEYIRTAMAMPAAFRDIVDLWHRFQEIMEDEA